MDINEFKHCYNIGVLNIYNSIKSYYVSLAYQNLLNKLKDNIMRRRTNNYHKRMYYCNLRDYTDQTYPNLS